MNDHHFSYITKLKNKMSDQMKTNLFCNLSLSDKPPQLKKKIITQKSFSAPHPMGGPVLTDFNSY